MKTSPLPVLTLLTVAALSLRAEAPRYGVQGLIKVPLGDLKEYVDSKPGPGFGIHGTFDLGDGHMLRPRLDYSLFPEASFSSIKQKAACFSLGGDYLYFIAEKPERLYLIAGLSAIRWSFEHTDPVSRVTSNTTKFGLAGGVGYQWNATVGTEARYVLSSAASGFKADALQVGVTVRF